MKHERSRSFPIDPSTGHVRCTCGEVFTEKGFKIHQGMKNTRRHDPTDHKCVGGVRGDLYPF